MRAQVHRLGWHLVPCGSLYSISLKYGCKARKKISSVHRRHDPKTIFRHCKRPGTRKAWRACVYAQNQARWLHGLVAWTICNSSMEHFKADRTDLEYLVLLEVPLFSHARSADRPGDQAMQSSPGAGYIRKSTRPSSSPGACNRRKIDIGSSGRCYRSSDRGPDDRSLHRCTPVKFCFRALKPYLSEMKYERLQASNCHPTLCTCALLALSCSDQACCGRRGHQNGHTLTGDEDGAKFFANETERAGSEGAGRGKTQPEKLCGRLPPSPSLSLFLRLPPPGPPSPSIPPFLPSSTCDGLPHFP